jgi:hypothetical protein
VYRCTVGDGGIVLVTPAQLSLLALLTAAVPLLVLVLLSSLRLLAPSTVSEAVVRPLAGCCSAATVALFVSSNLMLRTSRRCRVDDAREREFSIGAAMLSSSCICYTSERYSSERCSTERLNSWHLRSDSCVLMRVWQHTHTGTSCHITIRRAVFKLALYIIV